MDVKSDMEVLARSEFILGSQRSGKSRRAENQADANACERVTLRVAGQALFVKGGTQ